MESISSNVLNQAVGQTDAVSEPSADKVNTEQSFAESLLADLKLLKRQPTVLGGKTTTLTGDHENPSPQTIVSYRSIGSNLQNYLIKQAEEAVQFAKEGNQVGYSDRIRNIYVTCLLEGINFSEQSGLTLAQIVAKAPDKHFGTEEVSEDSYAETQVTPSLPTINAGPSVVGINRFATTAAKAQAPKTSSEVEKEFNHLIQEAKKAFEEVGHAQASGYILQAIDFKYRHSEELKNFDLREYVDISVRVSYAREFENLLVQAEEKYNEGKLDEAKQLVTQAQALKIKNKHDLNFYGAKNVKRLKDDYVLIVMGKTPGVGDSTQVAKQ